MKLINKNSQRGFVNFLADYVLKKFNQIGEYNTIIEVTNVGKFIIINGLTNCETLINLSDVITEIKTDYPDYFNSLGGLPTNIIDTITYNVELKETTELWTTSYKTNRPQYHISQEENLTDNVQSISYLNEPIVEIEPNTPTNLKYYHSPLNITSEFPYGYSFKMGRNLLYYSEYISYNIFNTIGCNEMDVKISTNLNEDNDYDIEVISKNSRYSDNSIKSLILDCFDISEINEYTKEYDILDDILNPLSSKPWLTKTKLNELIIV